LFGQHRGGGVYGNPVGLGHGSGRVCGVRRAYRSERRRRDDRSTGPAGGFTDGNGDYRVELLSVNFTQRKTTGQVTVTPPEGSSLAEKVVAGVVLETGQNDPDTVLDVILDEQ
jgi:hypothetical protein